MIKIDTIKIEEFRGIRDLTLDLQGKNFGICGPNGTGKSGVVDAIEFVLRGDITRLSGEGSGELSVGKHGPHVDAGEKSDKAVVTLKGTLTRIDKDVTITRSVKRQNKPTIEPNEPDIIAEVEELTRHPEFALSRREIAKYIMTSASKRASDVQNLLRLSEIDRIGKALNTAANKEKSSADQKRAALDMARRDFLSALGVEEPNSDLILTAINERREVLGLDPLAALDEGIDITAGLQGDQGAETTVAKSVAKADVAEFIQTRTTSIEETEAARLELIGELKALGDDTASFIGVRRQTLVRQGLAMVDGDECPLCDTPWQEADLRAHLEAKLASATEAEKTINAIKEKLEPIQQQEAGVPFALEKLVAYAKALKLDAEAATLTEWATSAKDHAEIYRTAFQSEAALTGMIDHLGPNWGAAPPNGEGAIQVLQSAIETLPDKSKEDEARDVLMRAGDRFAISLQRRANWESAKVRADQAGAIAVHFATTSTDSLTEIYDAVAKDFSDFYRVLNRGDEDLFEGRLVAEPAKLSFDVDFYDRGKFPPGAFHSEGHQDGMGLCLYLALARHTLGEDFQFSVLDDVLMSVDTSHRREVCRLLTSEFPNTQFILTTHDRVWLQYMRSENLIDRAQLFSGWSVDTGPRIWDDQDVWTDIAGALKKEDVPRAAALLRRYLEHVGNVLCDGLRAPVPYRGDGKYDLGDLLPPGLAQAKKHFKLAKSAATSWGHIEKAETIQETIEAYSNQFQASDVERWMINPSVHYSEWANFTAGEFRPVAAAYEALLDMLRCEGCKSFLYVSTHKGKPADLRCACGDKRFGLQKKPAA